MFKNIWFKKWKSYFKYREGTNYMCKKVYHPFYGESILTADKNKKIKLWTINKIDNINEKYINNISENESIKE